VRLLPAGLAVLCRGCVDGLDLRWPRAGGLAVSPFSRWSTCILVPGLLTLGGWATGAGLGLVLSTPPLLVAVLGVLVVRRGDQSWSVGGWLWWASAGTSCLGRAVRLLRSPGWQRPLHPGRRRPGAMAILSGCFGPLWRMAVGTCSARLPCPLDAWWSYQPLLGTCAALSSAGKSRDVPPFSVRAAAGCCAGLEPRIAGLMTYGQLLGSLAYGPFLLVLPAR